MNYIHRLQNENAEKDETIRELEQRIENLRWYVTSSKFRCGNELDGLVRTTDVILRLETP